MSGLRCRPGDLAVVVKSWAGNEGRIVRCLELVGCRIWITPDRGESVVAAWRTDTLLRDVDGDFDNEIADDQLRPIRDSDGQDEMLRIAGLPENIKRESAHKESA